MAVSSTNPASFPAWKMISSTTLTAGQTSSAAITLPAGTNIFKIIVSASSDAANTPFGIIFNNDTGNNYSWCVNSSTSTSSAVTTGTAAAFAKLTLNSNTDGLGEIILKRSSTNMQVSGQFATGTYAYIANSAGFWSSGSAATSFKITLNTGAGVFLSGGSIILMGI